MAILALSCQGSEQRDAQSKMAAERRDPFGPNTPIDPKVRFERQLRCSEVGERFTRWLEEKGDPGALVAFYCYSPTLNTCVAVIDHPDRNSPSYVWDMLTNHQIAESSSDHSAPQYFWFLNVRTSLGNECLATGVQRMTGPIGKMVLQESAKPPKSTTSP